MHEKRVQFRKANDQFEFNRRSFYRKLCEGEKPVGQQDDEEMTNYWSKIWSKNNESDETKQISIIENTKSIYEVKNDKINEQHVIEAIGKLANWKTPGIDQVYNFFIKICKPVHATLAEIILDLIKHPSKMPKWLTTGTTYLIPKNSNPQNASEYRPITCLPTLYKLTTKVVAEQLMHFVNMNDILSKNQMGTRRDCQGAKELALLNKNINKRYENTLYTTWFDVKKAFDTVNHTYLLDCLKTL